MFRHSIVAFSALTLATAMHSAPAGASDKFLQPGMWTNGKTCVYDYKRYLQTQATGPKSTGAFWPGTVMVVGFHPDSERYRCHVATFFPLESAEQSVMRSCLSAYGVQKESCKVWMRVP